MTVPLSDDDLQKLYAWIDAIPLSKPKKNIARDFSDALLIAEVSLQQAAVMVPSLDLVAMTAERPAAAIVAVAAASLEVYLPHH